MLNKQYKHGITLTFGIAAFKINKTKNINSSSLKQVFCYHILSNNIQINNNLTDKWLGYMKKQEHCMQYQLSYVRGPSFYLKFLAEKGHNSKTIAYRVMPLVLQLHLVIMSEYSKSGLVTFNTFWVMGYIKVFV